MALDHEEFPRPGTTAESLATLAPSFPAVADYRYEDNPTFRELINMRYPDLDIVSTSTTPATRPASSTARPRC